MTGQPVLVSIEDIGPVFGRLYFEQEEIELLDPFGDFERPIIRKSWRIEVADIPHRLLMTDPGRITLVGRIEGMATPMGVRIWGAIEDTCYTGWAYGRFGDAPLERTLPRRIAITLNGAGPLERERR